MKRAAIISGGGAWGAFGGGTLAKLNCNYDTIIGISTGALMSPLVALKEWELLKMAYTSINDDNIFDNCWYKPHPFTKNGKINLINVLITLILGEKTLATSKQLRKTISRYFSEDDFNEIRKQNKEILVGVQNYTEIPSKLYYFSSDNEKYQDFLDWMWASANPPFITTLMNKSWHDKNGNFQLGQWTDGGVTELIGINHAITKNFDEIDIIVHRPKEKNIGGTRIVKTLIDNVTTTISAMRYDIEFEFFYHKIRFLNKIGTNVNVYWLPRKLSKNPMMFDEKLMMEWWDEGYDTAFNPDRVEIFKSN